MRSWGSWGRALGYRNSPCRGYRLGGVCLAVVVVGPERPVQAEQGQVWEEWDEMT